MQRCSASLTLAAYLPTHILLACQAIVIRLHRMASKQRRTYQAKKYNKAARGCPTRQKLTQKMTLPIIFPLTPRIFSRGAVTAIKGNCNIIPVKATPNPTLVAIPGRSPSLLTNNVMGRYPYEQLVQNAREHEDHDAGGVRAISSSYQRRVDVPPHE